VGLFFCSTPLFGRKLPCFDNPVFRQMVERHQRMKSITTPMVFLNLKPAFQPALTALKTPCATNFLFPGRPCLSPSNSSAKASSTKTFPRMRKTNGMRWNGMKREMSRRSAVPGANAVKLLRTFAAQTEALQRYRGNVLDGNFLRPLCTSIPAGRQSLAR